jgi:phosphoglucosamine mutase
MLFGTDGVRGVANQDLTVDLALAIGRAMAGMLPRPSTVVIGRDTRVSGPSLQAAVTAGLTAGGVDVIVAGIVPTPALAYLIRHFQADGGVMISASHNPPEYNGIKLLNRQGGKWSQADEQRVEELVTQPAPPARGPMGRVLHYEQTAIVAYHRYLVSIFAGSVPRALSVVLDVGHGAATMTAPAVFEQLGISTWVLHREPLGERINQQCGATHPAVLREQVLARQADLGLAFDGDADRVIAVDRQGRVVDGDEILYVIARGLHEQGRLPHNLVVATVMSNLGLEQALAHRGIELVRTPVGDRWVAEMMEKTGAALGGEQSGHVIV